MTYEYVAGFFDGEGSIFFQKPKFQIRLSFAQSSEKVLKDIKEFIGYGSIYHSKSKEERHKDRWVLYILGINRVEKVLLEMLPFLIVKKDKALKALSDIQTHRKKVEENKKLILERKVKGIELLKLNHNNYSEIARIVGVHRQTVSSWAKEI